MSRLSSNIHACIKLSHFLECLRIERNEFDSVGDFCCVTFGARPRSRIERETKQNAWAERTAKSEKCAERNGSECARRGGKSFYDVAMSRDASLLNLILWNLEDARPVRHASLFFDAFSCYFQRFLFFILFHSIITDKQFAIASRLNSRCLPHWARRAQFKKVYSYDKIK